MQKDQNSLGLRKLGILTCFKEFYRTHDRIPDNPKELLTVTSSALNEKNFQKYREWFLDFTGGSHVK